MKYSFPKRGHYYTVMKVEVIRPNVAPCLREMSAKQLKPKVSVVGKPPSEIQRTKVRICCCIRQVLFFHNSFIALLHHKIWFS